MSNSLASAKRRRAGVQQPEPVAAPPTPSSATPTQPRGRVSIPQMLNLFDGRLTKLESSLNEVKPQSSPSLDDIVVSHASDTNPSTTISLAEYMSDMDKKFFMLAEEITNMKDIVLKLQTFTMDVNKTLHDERINVLSEHNVKFEIGEDTINNLSISTDALGEAPFDGVTLDVGQSLTAI
jgi:hypothetical protein